MRYADMMIAATKPSATSHTPSTVNTPPEVLPLNCPIDGGLRSCFVSRIGSTFSTGAPMRRYESLIQEAELEALSPEAVAEFLKNRAGQPHGGWLWSDDPVDEDAERALRARGEPLIDLALARYGRHMGVVSELFQASNPISPIRLACLANRALGHEILMSFPRGLFRNQQIMAEWLLSAPDEELSALFENPTLNDSFLRELLERSQGHESITDDRLSLFVFILHKNPRMRTPWDDDRFDDGYDAYNYNSVFDAAWKLAGVVPATENWGMALGWLYEELPADAFSIKEPLLLTSRWHIDPADQKALERQSSNHAIGYLGNKERVRKGLARLALCKNGRLLSDLLASDDVALRAAAYAAGDFNADQLRAGYDKDGEIAFNQACGNLDLWQYQSTRQALCDIAWKVVRADKHKDWGAAYRFKSMEKDLRMKHPAWFADEEEGEESGYDEDDDQAMATKRDLAAIASQMDRQSRGLDAVSQVLRGLRSRTGWIWWFSLGALVASLWRL